jgi:hypothetical protein
LSALGVLSLTTRDHVGRFRIRHSARQAQQVRAEIKNAAEITGLHPAGLSRAAIVCVRTLKTRLDRGQVPWSQLQGDVQQLVASAARPARGPVGSVDGVVIFADAAELLACLARDWGIGELRSRWWWRALLGPGIADEIVRREWLVRPQLFPAALRSLAALDAELGFLRQLSPDDLTLLWDELLTTFHLPALRQRSEFNSERLDKSDGSDANSDRALAAIPPWARQLSLDRERRPSEQRLIVIGSLLEESPALVRAAAFAPIYQRGYGHRIRDFATFIERPLNRARTHASTDVLASKSSATVSAIAEPPASVEAANTASSGWSPPLRFRDAPAGAPPRIDAEARADSKPASPSTALLETLRPTVPLPQTVSPAAGARDFTLAGDCVATDWGGVFYLVNVALAIGIYGDFTSPAHPGLALPTWDFLALFGREFVGPRFADDPLDALLARLAGRTDRELPGAHFEPPDDHPLRTWLDHTTHGLRSRLEAALNAPPPDNFTAIVFAHRAEICATPTRVDVTFSLATHPIELRLAGLDRDPGWVPAAGRIIAFHYE